MWLDAGYTCTSTWSDVCTTDHPLGAQSNSLKVQANPNPNPNLNSNPNPSPSPSPNPNPDQVANELCREAELVDDAYYVLEARRTAGQAVPLPAINVIIEAREIARYGRDMGEI